MNAAPATLAVLSKLCHGIFYTHSEVGGDHINSTQCWAGQCIDLIRLELVGTLGFGLAVGEGK